MERKIYLFGFLVSFLCFACTKSDMEYENDYEKSYKAWRSFKKSSNNSYRYVVSGATWAGAAWETAITVSRGEVTGRNFSYTVFGDIPMPAVGWSLETAQSILDSLSKRYQGDIGHLPSADSLLKVLTWREQKPYLNDPKHRGGAPIWTLDQVYEEAKNNWLKKRDNADTFFKVDNKGMISSCGYWEHGCMDDCFRGISIKKIEAL
ncbi:hypothetical protein [Olivibacter sp. XZL3]|uniref:hypothetical protein n=1 Tax=Olivibacter sp. XZL3 TaxID=1735116 RepID=UPI001065BE55|nr:hypothetical protein [Olivibacter sp. XZL3]